MPGFIQQPPALAVNDLFVPVQFYDPTNTPSDEVDFAAGWSAVKCPDNTVVEFGANLVVPDQANSVDDVGVLYFCDNATNQFKGTFQVVGDSLPNGDPGGATSKTTAPTFQVDDFPADSIRILKVVADLSGNNAANIVAGDYMGITIHRDAGVGSDIIYIVGFLIYLS